MPHVIPPGWQDVVNRVSGWLDEATQRLDEHEREFLLRFSTEPVEAALDLSSLAERLRLLPRKLEPLDAALAQSDAAAREVETALRELARRSESSRLRLAERATRAIG